MRGERKGKCEGREVYQCTVLWGKAAPSYRGRIWTSSSLSLLTSLISCLGQHLSIWKYPFARDKVFHHLSAWIRMKNKEMRVQGHLAFKSLSAVSSQESQIKELWVCRGKTSTSLETQFNFFLNDGKSYPHDEGAHTRVSEGCSKDFKFSQNLSAPPCLSSQSLKLIVDFSVPKLGRERTSQSCMS